MLYVYELKGTVVKSIAKTGLNISVEVPTQLDPITMQNRNKDTELKDFIDSIPSLTCKILLGSAQTCQNVKLHITCNLPIVAVPDSVFYSSIGSVQFEQEVCFYMKTNHIPTSLDVNICATYAYSNNGSSKLAEHKFRLPLKLVMKAGQQLQQDSQEDSETKPKIFSGLKKLTLETNKPCVNLTEIFPEFAASYAAASGNVLTAQFYGHPKLNISINCSKSGSSRYRIYSDDYDSMWLIVQELVTRLSSHFAKQSQEVLINYQETLPTQDLKLIIDRHLELRQILDTYTQNLEQCCVQFRAIQKRLLTKFKDKSPTSLDNMDALLEATYRQISLISDKCLATKKELSYMTNSLNCISNLYALLLSFIFKFSKEGLEILESVMTNQIEDTADLVS